MSTPSPTPAAPIAAIREAFALSQRSGQTAALMPYLTLGFPTPEASLAAIEAAARAGAHLFELGVPFSDPLADGPTIQHAAQVALEQGITVARSLEMVAELRQRGVRQPFLLMGYYNPFLQFGLERIVVGAANAGANGFIVPDLPYEEADEFERLCALHGLALVYLLAPTSSPQRIRAVAERSTAFLYLVSLTGVTGARTNLPVNLADFVDSVRAICPADLPVAVGFGISTPEQAAAVGALADGVIIGSAFVNAVGRSERSDSPGSQAAESAAFAFVQEIQAGLRSIAGDPSPAAEAEAYAPHHINPPSQTRRMTDALEDNEESQDAQGQAFLGC